jgi:nucleoside recognition membrane protein YjiH
MSALRFLVFSTVGLFFFALPVPADNRMYIPALLVQEATLPSRFFIATLSISQLIFFSAVAPMMIDMFRDVPVRAPELIALFLMRTAVLIPLLAVVTALLQWAGVFG